MMAIALAILGAIALPLAQWMIFSYAPVEESMGETQKIFYIHLPLAIWGLISFCVVFIAAVMYLWRKKDSADALGAAACELGVLFAGLALCSGMIWAKQAWGVWWTWDPRLATTLVMWFVYSGYLLLRHMDWETGRRNMVCAIFAVIAFLDVPLVFFSARIFRSIHPAVFGNPNGGLDPEMRLTAALAVVATGFLWGALLLTRRAQLLAEAKASELVRQSL